MAKQSTHLEGESEEKTFIETYLENTPADFRRLQAQAVRRQIQENAPAREQIKRETAHRINEKILGEVAEALSDYLQFPTAEGKAAARKAQVTFQTLEAFIISDDKTPPCPPHREIAVILSDKRYCMKFYDNILKAPLFPQYSIAPKSGHKLLNRFFLAIADKTRDYIKTTEYTDITFSAALKGHPFQNLESEFSDGDKKSRQRCGLGDITIISSYHATVASGLFLTAPDQYTIVECREKFTYSSNFNRRQDVIVYRRFKVNKGILVAPERFERAVADRLGIVGFPDINSYIGRRARWYRALIDKNSKKQ